ncbi:biopolymer transporter ExbD [Roseibium sp.]|uniref:ExbD/TolR family protein n=1 Tax=Roseibium sp. TaxID=1936156 RepID=UPI003266D7C5
MRVDRPARKQKPISLTPLVDVIFLLLLFFMLSSTFTTFGQLDLGAPAGSGGTGTVPEAILVLEETGLRLNGREIGEDLLMKEAQSLLDRDVDSILLLVRGATTTQQLVAIMSRLKSLPDLKIVVANAQ